MSIQNKKYVILFPLILATVLIAGIFIGIRFNKSGVSDRLLIYPKADKVNNVLNLIEDSYVDPISREKLEETAIESVLQKLDPHSVYISADEVEAANEPLEGNFNGIGIQYYVFRDTIMITSVTENGPSLKAGLKAGDRLIKVNDTIIAGRKIAKTDVIRKLRGKKDSMVKITIKRPGVDGLLNFQVQRGPIPLHSVDVAYMLEPGIGYLKINKFSKNTYDEFIEGVKNLRSQGMQRLVVDLRDNSGGYLESAIKIADEFLDDHQLIVYTQGRARKRTDAFSTPGGVCLKDSLVIIIDESSASAAEVLAGAIQDNDRGWIVGRRSFGKGLVQEPTLLPGGAAIRLTIARYYTPTGRCIQKPYKNGKESYYKELQKRAKNGEMEISDSIKFTDSLKYITRGGRIVYGGGGIMPDFFVPADTTSLNKFYYRILEKGLIYKFSVFYTDQKRRELEKFDNYTELLAFLEEDLIMSKFLEFASKEGVKTKLTDSASAKPVIETYLKGFIVRNFFDNKGFYPVVNSIDQAVKKAIEVSKGKNNQMLSLIKAQPPKRQRL